MNRRDEIIKELAIKHDCSEKEVIDAIDSLEHVWEVLREALFLIFDTVKEITQNYIQRIEELEKRDNEFCSHLKPPKINRKLTMPSQIPRLEPLQVDARSNL